VPRGHTIRQGMVPESELFLRAPVGLSSPFCSPALRGDVAILRWGKSVATPRGRPAKRREMVDWGLGSPGGLG